MLLVQELVYQLEKPCKVIVMVHESSMIVHEI